MKTNKKLKIHANKRKNDDPLSFMFVTDNDEIFMSSSGRRNKSNFIPSLNLIYANGDSDHIGKYLADWFITVSNKVINSNLFTDNNGYNVVSVVISKEIQLVSDSRRNDLKSLKESIMELLRFNSRIKMIKMSGRNEYAIEDETGRTVLNNKIMDFNCQKQKVSRKSIHK